MTNSGDKIIEEQSKARKTLYFASSFILVISIVVTLVVVSCYPDKANKLLVSYGLILDVMGVFLASYPIILPLKKKAEKGVTHLSNQPQYRAQLVTEYAEQHGLKAQIGIIMIGCGFFMQFISNWI